MAFFFFSLRHVRVKIDPSFLIWSVWYNQIRNNESILTCSCFLLGPENVLKYKLHYPKGNNFCILQIHPSVDLCDLPVVPKPTLLKDMKELLEDETLKDLDIKVRGDKIVRCHRFVLAATSSKWEQLLNSSQGMLL